MTNVGLLHTAGRCMTPALDHNGLPVPPNAPFVIYTDDQGQVLTVCLNPCVLYLYYADIEMLPVLRIQAFIHSILSFSFLLHLNCIFSSQSLLLYYKISIMTTSLPTLLICNTWKLYNIANLVVITAHMRLYNFNYIIIK